MGERDEMHGCYTLKPPSPLHLSIPHLPDELLVLFVQLCQRVLVHHLPQLLQIGLSKLILGGREEGEALKLSLLPCTRLVVLITHRRDSDLRGDLLSQRLHLVVRWV